MGEQFDPAWEYWAPSEEMAELMDHEASSFPVRAVSGIAALISCFVDSGDDSTSRTAISGLRFGSNPKRINHPYLREAHARRERIRDVNPRSLRCPPQARPPRQILPCRVCRCGSLFRPRRHGARWCSIECWGEHKFEGRGRHARLDPRTCPHCRVVFRPWCSKTKYCSMSCSMKTQWLNGKVPPRHRDPGKLAQFRLMYLRGDRMTDIGLAIGIENIVTLKRYRATLNLPPRPCGNSVKAKADWLEMVRSLLPVKSQDDFPPPHPAKGLRSR